MVDIYVCNDCKIILDQIFLTYEKIIQKVISHKSPVYITNLIKDDLMTITCPYCNNSNVSQLHITQENFNEIHKLLQEDNIKDAMEILFELLL